MLNLPEHAELRQRRTEIADSNRCAIKCSSTSGETFDTTGASKLSATSCAVDAMLIV